MSLRGFHLVFVTAAIVLAFWFAYYEWAVFQQGNAVVDLVIAGVAVVVGVALAAYEVWFYVKSRKLNL